MNYEQTVTWAVISIIGTILVCIGAAFNMNDPMAFNHEMGAFLGATGAISVIVANLYGFWALFSSDNP